MMLVAIPLLVLLQILGFLLGVASLALTVFIFRRQDKQLKQLESIGVDTSKTAQTLKADRYAEDITKKLFLLLRDPSGRFRCTFPVHYDRRPIPLIFAGDYHALQVIQGLLGRMQGPLGRQLLDLEPIPVKILDPLPPVTIPDSTATVSDHTPASAQGAGSATSSVANSEEHTAQTNPRVVMPVVNSSATNTIYLCSPQANPVLAKIAPQLTLVKDEHPASPKFANVELPCWFADDCRDGNKRRVIWISGTAPLTSPAEEHYDAAFNLPRFMPYSPSSRLQTDFALLLRITLENRKHIVIAGIHQYGTWIGGEFLRKLANEEELGEQATCKVLLGENDFLSVIWGEFDSQSLTVEQCTIHDNYLWTRADGDQWSRVK